MDGISTKYTLNIWRLSQFVFQKKNPRCISRNLEQHAINIFEGKKFNDFLTRVCIVATNVDQDRAMIFKSHLDQLYTGTSDYDTGFGSTIADAVLGSSAAVPYLNSRQVLTTTDGMVHVVDGGFVANNPALFAVTDAVGALGKKQREISLVSIGTGRFTEREPKAPFLRRMGRLIVNNYMPTDIFSKSMSASSEAADSIVGFAFPNIKKFRLSEHYTGSNFATHLLESDVKKLQKMYSFGRSSFCKNEKAFDRVYEL